MSRKLLEIERAKGITIILVGLGHVIARQGPTGNDWAIQMKELIYSFHMPLFMFLSGLIMFYTYKPIKSFNHYSKYVSKKFMRLMPAFLIFSVLVFAGKYFGGKFFHIDNGVSSLFEYFKILIIPQKSFSNYLWYIYVLFFLYAIFPILISGFKSIIFIIIFSFLVSLSGIFINYPALFSFELIVEYLFFFALGGGVIAFYDKWLLFIKKYGFYTLLLFATALFLRLNIYIPKMLMGFLSIPAVYYLVCEAFFKNSKTLEVVGKYTFIIYLLNTMIIGVLKAVLFKFHDWNGLHFLYYFPILAIGGIIIPIYIKKYIIIKIPFLNKIT